MFRTFFGILIILIGIGFFFNINVFNFIFPIILILIGIRILTGQSRNWDLSQSVSSQEDELTRVLIFSGMNQKVTSENFTKCELVTVFGGGDVDLSSVKTKAKEINLDLVAVFGGWKVKIPADWKVSSEGVGIVGGFSNRAKGNGPVNVVVKGVAIFGGVEVVN